VQFPKFKEIYGGHFKSFKRYFYHFDGFEGYFYHFGGFMGYSIILMVYRHLDDFGNLKVTLVILKALKVFWLFKRFYRYFYHFRNFHYILFILEAFKMVFLSPRALYSTKQKRSFCHFRINHFEVFLGVFWRV
jgi:hypothetical protein